MSIEDNININKEIDNKNRSINEELNPIVIQLIEFGYDKIYSRRVFHYFHPDDLEEALNYMAIDNGIIQHRFIKDNIIAETTKACQLEISNPLKIPDTINKANIFTLLDIK